jgi:hypothetical protein
MFGSIKSQLDSTSQRFAGHRIRPWLPALFEITILALWTLLVARPYLNADPYVVPSGRDFIVNTQGNNIWIHARNCGLCMLWNGDIQGGAPAFVDTLSANMHPLVALTTFFWGVVNGAKIVIVASLFMTGIGQWLLGRVLGVSRLAGLWSAAMAIAAGHLFGALTGGLFPILTSIAAASLLFPTLISLVQRPRRRLTVIVGGLFALLVVSGQGYVQIGFVLALPLFALLLIGRGPSWRLVLHELLLAGGLGALLAAPFLVPLAHFYPHFYKEPFVDFAAAEPFGNTILNLVVNDWEFFNSEALGKLPYPEWYINFIGWPAVALAAFGGVYLWTHGNRRMAVFLSIYPLFVMWLSAAQIFIWFFNHRNFSEILADFSGAMRTPALMAKLAVMPILGLAAVGIDRLFSFQPIKLGISWSTFRAPEARARQFSVPYRLVFVVLAVVVLLRLRSAGQQWMGTQTYPETEIQAVLGQMQTPNLAWVQPPYGESMWVLAALEQGYKLSFFHRPWDWKTTGEDPLPAIVASRNVEQGLLAKGSVGEITIYEASEPRNYAAIFHADGSQTPCAARGEAGNITVTCNASSPGTLVVQEHAYSGWKSSVNGRGEDVETDGQWLQVPVAAGSTTIELRYRPMDVMLGIVLMVIGLGLSVMWLTAPNLLARIPAMAHSPSQEQADILSLDGPPAAS